jgi:hypothetical protein
MHTKLKKRKCDDEDMNAAVSKKEREEIELVHGKLKAVDLLMKGDVSGSIPVCNPLLFIMEKFKVDVMRNKFKNLLVAH